jgi:hypothetical protein
MSGGPECRGRPGPRRSQPRSAVARRGRGSRRQDAMAAFLGRFREDQVALGATWPAGTSATAARAMDSKSSAPCCQAAVFDRHRGLREPRGNRRQRDGVAMPDRGDQAELRPVRRLDERVAPELYLSLRGEVAARTEDADAGAAHARENGHEGDHEERPAEAPADPAPSRPMGVSLTPPVCSEYGSDRSAPAVERLPRVGPHGPTGARRSNLFFRQVPAAAAPISRSWVATTEPGTQSRGGRSRARLRANVAHRLADARLTAARLGGPPRG